MSDASTDPVRWIEVRALAPLGWEELVAEALWVEGTSGAAVGRTTLGLPEPPEGSDWVRAYLPEHLDGPGPRARIAAALARLSEATGAPELAGLTATFRPLPPEDWASSWRKVWKPFRVGRLAVIPPWSERAARPDDVVVRYEPGSAFGSGRHATTRTCLRLVAERVRGGERVLDAGTGSGLLSVAALRLGARSAVAFDVDPNAALAAGALARANGVSERMQVEAAGFEVLERSPGPYDVVLANLYADLIQERAAELAAALAPSGWLAVSGCPLDKREPTRAALERAGLSVAAERRRGRWVTFDLRRGGSSAARRHTALGPHPSRDDTA